MMTGAILGGSSVQQAARLQMVIMFMISSSTALASIVTTVLALSVVVDNEHRVRSDRIDIRPHAVWRARSYLVARMIEAIKPTFTRFKNKLSRRKDQDEGEQGEDTERLLG